MMRVRYEHGEWTYQTVELGEQTGVCTSDLYGFASGWASVATDNDRARELTSRGLELEPYGACRYGRTIGLAFVGRSDSPGAAADLRRVMELDPRPRTQFWSLEALTAVELTGPQAGSIIEEVIANAEQIGAPSMIAYVMQYQGRYKMANGLPGAEEDLRTAVAMGDAVGNVPVASWSRYLLAESLFARRDPGASGALHEALSRTYDARVWAVVNASLHLCSRYLAETGRRPSAAPIRKYLGLRNTEPSGSDTADVANVAPKSSPTPSRNSTPTEQFRLDPAVTTPHTIQVREPANPPHGPAANGPHRVRGSHGEVVHDTERCGIRSGRLRPRSSVIACSDSEGGWTHAASSAVGWRADHDGDLRRLRTPDLIGAGRELERYEFALAIEVDVGVVCHDEVEIVAGVCGRVSFADDVEPGDL